MHKLFKQQLEKATRPDGAVDFAVLEDLVSSAYEEMERDRRRTDRSIALMIDEVEQGMRERERTAELLGEEKRKLDIAINNMTLALLMFDKDARLVFCSNRYIELYGLQPERVLPGTPLRELLEMRRAVGTFSEDSDEFIDGMRSTLGEKTVVARVNELPDGRVIFVSNRLLPDGSWVSTHEDITEQHRMLAREAMAEARIREQKVRLDAALNNMAHGLCMFDAQGRLMLCNKQYAEFLDLPRELAQPGVPFHDIVANRASMGLKLGDLRQFVDGVLRQMREGRICTKILETSEGRSLRVVDTPMPGGGWVATFEDITRQRQAERERDRNQAFLNTIIDSVPSIIFVKDAATHQYVLVNRSGEAYFGRPREELIGRTALDFFPPATAEQIQQRDSQVLESGNDVVGAEYNVHFSARGDRIVSSTRVRIVDETDRPRYLLGVIEDITERKRAEAAERQNAEVLTATITAMGDALLVVNPEGRVLVANPAASGLFGEQPEGGWPRWMDSYSWMHPDGTAVGCEDNPLHRAARGESVNDVELMLQRAGDTGTVHLIASGRPMRDAGGTLRGAVVVYRDVTDSTEIERQFRQSQKMDAIGQLTGGIAHDFNNILTVITGTIEILADSVADQPEALTITRMISQAAGRGADLTRQLLAFSRKQPLRPQQTDLQTLLHETTRLLSAAVGENIQIKCSLHEETWPALVDKSQLTTALLNLAVNARDAMPNGGRLSIETENVVLDADHHIGGDVQAGDYVRISVTDEGVGIPAAIRDKVFEPFFTTKGVGKGTGLGLSMVYGFVKQSGGQIRIYSEEGHGTSIKIYLPRAGSASPVEEAPVPSSVRGGSETILVVEDDALVRQHATNLLQNLGYRTIVAENGADALARIDQGAEFDLLFTDVIMPGMNGRELAEQLVNRRPFARVLFTSGYTENAILQQGRLPAGVLLVAKPYRKSELARLVREALERPPLSTAA